MSALPILIPVSIGMGLIGLCAFFWAMRAKQFEDPEGNAWRVIQSETAKCQNAPSGPAAEPVDHQPCATAENDRHRV